MTQQEKIVKITRILKDHFYGVTIKYANDVARAIVRELEEKKHTGVVDE